MLFCELFEKWMRINKKYILPKNKNEFCFVFVFRSKHKQTATIKTMINNFLRMIISVTYKLIIEFVKSFKTRKIKYKLTANCCQYF